MATQLSIFIRAIPRTASMQPQCRYPHGAFSVEPRLISMKNWRIKVSDGRDSYLDMWKKAVEREKQENEFRKIAENVVEEDNEETEEVLEKKSGEFQKLLEVSPEERDRVQRMQVIDRAAAAIAAARAILKEDKAEESSIEVEGNNDDDDQGSLVSLSFENELEGTLTNY